MEYIEMTRYKAKMMIQNTLRTVNNSFEIDRVKFSIEFLSVYMYIVHVHLCTYVCLYVCMYVCMHVGMCASMHVPFYVCELL